MKDIGIDLGTANVLIYEKGVGIILNEPTVIAINQETKQILAIGKDANKMIGRTPGKIKAIKPLKEGVIADFEYTEEMLFEFLTQLKRKGFNKPRILICCPANITMVEKNALKETAERVGAKKIYIEEEPKVAAIGAGLKIEEPTGNMVVDIGGGTTDVALLSLGGIVNSESIKIAGNNFDYSIIEYIKNKYKLLIGERTAEDIKIKIGNVYNPNKENVIEIKGRNIATGLPSMIEINEEEVEEALLPLIKEIIKVVKKVLEKAPPELSADIVDKGIVLTGGGALLKGIADIFEEELKVPIYVAESPLTCVAEGCGIMLENLDIIDK